MDSAHRIRVEMDEGLRIRLLRGFHLETVCHTTDRR